jgi:hypothetical protein
MTRATVIVNQIKGLDFQVGGSVIMVPSPYAITMMLLPQERRVHHRQAHGMLLQLQRQNHM